MSSREEPLSTNVSDADDQLTSTDIYIAVMGKTGVGKSRFISQCTGRQVKIGDDLLSCTTDVDVYSLVWNGKTIHMIDTPGFDDDECSDRDVLERIAAWMGSSYKKKIRINAVMYLHRITDNRIGGSGKRNLYMFKELCGADFYPRITLITTHWDEVNKKDGEYRLQQLVSMSDLWYALIQGGAATEAHYGSEASAKRILEGVLAAGEIIAPDVLTVQREMVDEKRSLDQTAAGRQVEAALDRLRVKHMEDIRRLQEEAASYRIAKDFEQAREREAMKEAAEARIRQSEEERSKLQATLEELQARQAEAIQRMQDEIIRDREEIRKQREEIEQEKNTTRDSAPDDAMTLALLEDIAQQEELVAEEEVVLAAKEESLKKTLRRVLMMGVDWIKKNPDAIKTGAKYGAKIASMLMVARAQQKAANATMKARMAQQAPQAASFSSGMSSTGPPPYESLQAGMLTEHSSDEDV